MKSILGGYPHDELETPTSILSRSSAFYSNCSAPWRLKDVFDVPTMFNGLIFQGNLNQKPWFLSSNLLGFPWLSCFHFPIIQFYGNWISRWSTCHPVLGWCCGLAVVVVMVVDLDWTPLHRMVPTKQLDIYIYMYIYICIYIYMYNMINRL